MKQSGTLTNHEDIFRATANISRIFLQSHRDSLGTRFGSVVAMRVDSAVRAHAECGVKARIVFGWRVRCADVIGD